MQLVSTNRWGVDLQVGPAIPREECIEATWFGRKSEKALGGGKFKRNNFSECFLGNLRTWHAKVTLRWYPALHHTRTRTFVPVSNMLSKPWPCAKQSGAKRERLKEAVADRHTPIIPNPTLFFSLWTSRSSRMPCWHSASKPVHLLGLLTEPRLNDRIECR